MVAYIVFENANVISTTSADAITDVDPSLRTGNQGIRTYLN